MLILLLTAFRRGLPIFVIFLLLTTNLRSQCDGAITSQIVTDCGTTFDLCMDRYVINPTAGIRLSIFANDDVGIFDPCDVSIVPGKGPYHGTLTNLGVNQNCDFWYVPSDPSYVGDDTFYYELRHVDLCSEIQECHCDITESDCINGKIWTIKSFFLGPDNSWIKVEHVKSQGQSQTVTDVLDGSKHTKSGVYAPVDYGDLIYVDLSSTDNVQPNAIYTWYTDSNGSPGSELGSVSVHTSCSAPIFNETYDAIRPISGCIDGGNDGSACAGNYGDGQDNFFGNGPFRTINAEPLTSITIDTTIVILTLSILPIELLEFETELFENSVVLDWTVAQFSTGNQFEIEKSVDGANFAKIGNLFFNTEQTSYSFEDLNPANGVNYYRLAMVDEDGSINYSEVKSIEYIINVTDGAIKIHPNPTKGGLEITLPGKIAENSIDISVYNLSGKLLFKKVRFSSNWITINDFKNLNAGMYFLKVDINGITTQTKKVIKQ